MFEGCVDVVICLFLAVSVGGLSSNAQSSEGGERVSYAGGASGPESFQPKPPAFMSQPFGGGVPIPPPRAPQQHQHAYPPPGAGYTSLQIRQEKEAELRANDQHWQRRINQLEETHQKINEIMEREYSAAVRLHYKRIT